MSTWFKITGTQVGKFILGLTGVTLKNNSGNLQVRNNADNAFASAEAQSVKVTDNTSGFGVTLQSSPSAAASYSLTLPVDDGSPSQVLATDGSGVLSWVSAASTADHWKVDTTSFEFGSGATISMFTLPANAVVDRVSVIVDAAFDGTPSMSVGVVGGSASLYVASSDVLLSVADRYDIPYQGTATGPTQALEINYSAGGATVGAARVLVTYAEPA
jgi:hypothetical protein